MTRSEQAAIERPPGRGAEVQIPVDFLLGRFGLAAAQPLVPVPIPPGWAWTAWSLPSFPCRASSTANSKCGRFRRCVPRLEHAAGAAERLGQRQALRDGLRAGLLAIHVLAGLGRVDREHGVPVRAGRDQHRVDIGAGQELAQVAIRRAVLIAVLGIDQPLDGLAASRLDVAHRHELHVRLRPESSSGRTSRGRRCRSRPARSVRWGPRRRPCPRRRPE